MRVILVTGSRALLRSKEATERGRKILEGLASELPEGSMIVTGDAPGPDAWAIEAARARRSLSVECYKLDGAVYRLDSDTSGRGSYVRLWTQDPGQQRASTGHRWPLLRNDAMVRDLAMRRVNLGDEISCIALVAMWSNTHGTEYTARQAEKHGILVTRIRFRADHDFAHVIR